MAPSWPRHRRPRSSELHPDGTALREGNARLMDRGELHGSSGSHGQAGPYARGRLSDGEVASSGAGLPVE
jgi:hypothetical protein